jgi:hypothetical protein
LRPPAFFMTCTEFLSLPALCHFFAFLQDLRHTQPWQAAAVALALGLGLILLLRLIVAAVAYPWRKKGRHTNRGPDPGMLGQSFAEVDFARVQHGYIPPDGSNINPEADQARTRQGLGVRQSVLAALWVELAAEGKHRILVLADAGMGKTTLLLNLMAREQAKKPGIKNPMALFALGQTDALDQIKAIADPHATILLLDALDEDLQAIQDSPRRMSEILQVTADFKTVVMTCRTRFFFPDADMPPQSVVQQPAGENTGEPDLYPWRAVYLLPFDEKQTQAFIQANIPLTRPGRRRKARQMVAQIPQLARQPVLTALVPALATSETAVQGLWEVYQFWLERCLQRESHWVDSATLRQMAQTIAVELQLNPEKHRNKRIAPADLSLLLQLAPEELARWPLTRESFLQRDGAGHYRFAHPALKEFLFVQALVAGDDRCVNVPWPALTRQLFLSWGHLRSHSLQRAQEIFELDLRPTGLFPLSEERHVTGELDASWAKRIFSDVAGQHAKFPHPWRAAISRIHDLGDLVRVYDFAEGLVWQLPKTGLIAHRDDRDVFKVDRLTRSGEDAYGNKAWRVPLLFELRKLVEVVSRCGQLDAILDERELYWVADADGQHCAVVRVRQIAKDNAAAVSYPQLIPVHSAISSAGDTRFAVDVYKANVRAATTARLRALPIMTLNGDAQALWHRDTEGQTDWTIAPVRVPTFQFKT